MSLLWPAWLLGLLGLGLPWLLHRFSRTDPPERPFPSKRFLQAAEPPVSRLQRLRYRGLFALRVLLLIGLCLLFAEPWLRVSATGGDDQYRHLIVIDTSLSQRLGERWERTLAAARNAIDAVPAGQSLQLLAADSSLNTLTEISTDPAAARAAVSALQPGHASLDYGELMQRLDVIAARSPQPVTVTLITDAQRQSLPQRLGALTARDLAGLSIVNVARPGERNDYLTASAHSADDERVRIAVTLGSSIVTAEPDSDTATVTGTDADGEQRAASADARRAARDATDTTGQAGRTRELVVSHDGEVLAAESVTLVPGETRTLLIDRLALPAEETVVLTVGFGDRDALPDDDTVDLVVRTAAPVGMGLQAVDTALPEQAAVFIATALQTDGAARIVDTPQSRGLPDTLQHAIVFADLDDSAAIPPAVLAFVQAGGNVLLVDTGGRRAPLPFESDAGIGVVDEAHPLALGTIDWYEARWYAAPRWASPRSGDPGTRPTVATGEEASSRPTGGATAPAGYRVLLSTTAGTPLLVERRRPEDAGSSSRGAAAVGSDGDAGLRVQDTGSLLLLADPLDGEFSDFPLQPAFVGFMQRLVDYFAASSALPERLDAGSRLDLPDSVQLLDADGERLSGLGGALSGRRLALDEPGLYQLVSQQGVHWLEVVIDAGESDLSVMQSADLQSWQARHDAGERAADAAAADADSQPEAGVGVVGQSGRKPLWPWLLPLASVLLIGESLFANRRLDVRRDGS